MFIGKVLTLILSLSILQPIAPKDPLDVDPNKPLGNVAPLKVSVSQFEKTYHKDILLPQYIPFTPTHTGGRFNELLQRLTVDYYNNQTNELLSISIYVQSNNPLKIQPEMITLVDGTKAEYLHADNYMADFIRFKKNNLFYEIGIAKNGKSEKMDDLLKVANSLE
ncbi:hypothetical protein [Brevibacillus parabrevis]|uniref:hypothetical protein n=1 Tax=Brevibacillus parabrevis TaxID=54914 RepID=UPI002380B54A|nr:hypothetical protein [Brevibacillus parabrevis]WDV93323.1 hypothetical protein PSE45_16840 [Brevibacillus parabrevis]